MEVSWAPNDALDIELERLPIVHHQEYASKLSEHGSDGNSLRLEQQSTIDEDTIQVAEQDYGLICPSSGKPVPLKSYHIRAEIVDVTVEVELFEIEHKHNRFVFFLLNK